MANDGGRVFYVPTEYYGLSALGQGLGQFANFWENKKERDRQFKLEEAAGERDERRLAQEAFQFDRNYWLDFGQTAGLQGGDLVQFMKNAGQISADMPYDMPVQERARLLDAEATIMGYRAFNRLMSEGPEALSAEEQMLAATVGFGDPEALTNRKINLLQVQNMEDDRASSLAYKAATRDMFGVELNAEDSMALSGLMSDATNRRLMEANIEMAKFDLERGRWEFRELKRLAPLQERLLRGQVRLTEAEAQEFGSILRHVPPQLMGRVDEFERSVAQLIATDDTWTVADSPSLDDVGKFYLNGTTGNERKDRLISAARDEIAKAEVAAREAATEALGVEARNAVFETLKMLYAASDGEAVDDATLYQAAADVINQYNVPGMEAGVGETGGFLGMGKKPILTFTQARALIDEFKADEGLGPDYTQLPATGGLHPGDISRSASEIIGLNNGNIANALTDIRTAPDYFKSEHGFSNEELRALEQELVRRQEGTATEEGAETPATPTEENFSYLEDIARDRESALSQLSKLAHGSPVGNLVGALSGLAGPSAEDVGRDAVSAVRGAWGAAQRVEDRLAGDDGVYDAVDVFRQLASQARGSASAPRPTARTTPRRPPDYAAANTGRITLTPDMEAGRQAGEQIGPAASRAASAAREGFDSFAQWQLQVGDDFRAALREDAPAIRDAVKSAPDKAVSLVMDKLGSTSIRVDADAKEFLDRMEQSLSGVLNAPERRRLRNRMSSIDTLVRQYVSVAENSRFTGSERMSSEMSSLADRIRRLGGRVPRMGTDGTWYR